MKIDIEGRLRNIQLTVSKALLPLYEAVINAIHAIEDAQIKDGKIDIFIERSSLQTGLIDDGNFAAIQGFKIVDNGIGFTDDNFEAFQTSDTTFKYSKGSKGIGRFLWLKAFSEVRVNSIYQKEGKIYRRQFKFTSSGDGIHNHSNEAATNTEERKTIVELRNFIDKYSSKCPQNLEPIARRIIEHCLIYFISDSSPMINIIDGSTTINLNTFFNEQIKTNYVSEKFTIKSREFEVFSFQLYRAETSEHKLHYCAQNREVCSEKLSKYIADLRDNKKIKDENGQLFTYFAYVVGKYFDENVNSERISFNIFDSSEDYELFPDEIFMEEIRENILSIVNRCLEPFLIDVRESKQQQVQKYVTSRAPQYRPLLKHHPEVLNEIPAGLTEEQLNIELYKQYSKIEILLKTRSVEILSNPIEEFDKYPEYREQYHRFLEQFNDFGKSKLAEYIVHRKTILEIFERNLQRDEDGRYQLERDVHEIIFPLKRTSDDVDFEKQNLWIIDEKLSYHKYLASDQHLNQSTEISSTSDDRPDILIFNNPFAFVEGNQPYSSIVIIEFKRPMRSAYGDEDDPIQQVYRYVKKIKSSSVVDKNGRLINLPAGVPFYAYIICDLTAKIKERAELANLLASPDSLGFFGYNQSISTYVEILSFDKLITDARKRNNMLFEKLQLL